jgi:hypothetical protein
MAAFLALAGVAGWAGGPGVARWLWVTGTPVDVDSRPVRAASAAVTLLLALVVLYRLDGRGPTAGQGPDLTALSLALLLGWMVRLQFVRAGRVLPARADRATRVTTAALVTLALVLAVPDLVLMATT